MEIAASKVGIFQRLGIEGEGSLVLIPIGGEGDDALFYVIISGDDSTALFAVVAVHKGAVYQLEGIEGVGCGQLEKMCLIFICYGHEFYRPFRCNNFIIADFGLRRNGMMKFL